MKIIAIGRNYAEHIAELNNERPTEPVIFTKPDTALLRNNDPFYYPEYTQDIHHEIEVVLRVSKEGKYIPEEFARDYVDQIGIGVDFTARDLQQKAKEKGLPWALAKGFNGSAPVGQLLPLADYPDWKNLSFSLAVNGEMRQEGHTSHMIYPFEFILAYISKFITLKTGDLIFTGTPKGVGPVAIGDRLVGTFEGQTLLDFEVK